MGEQAKLCWVPPNRWETPYSRTNGSFNPFPQPASAWKLDDDEFVADRKRYKAMGGRFREPLLITPAIMAHLDAALAARKVLAHAR